MQVFHWQNKIFSGQKTGKPTSPATGVTEENICAVHNLIDSDWHIKISEILSAAGVSYGSVKAIISNKF